MSKLKMLVAALAAAVLITTSIGAVSALDSVTETQVKEHTPLKVYKAYPNGESFKLKEAKRFALYFTDSKEIAKVSLTGIVKPQKVGTTRIRIVRLGDETKAVTIKVAKKQKISAPQFVNATYKDETKNISAETNAKGNQLYYESKNPDVVKINNRGDMTYGEVGKANIVITAKATNMFHEAKVVVPVAVGKKQAEITLAQPIITLPINYKDEKIEPVTESDGKISFESGDTAIVTVAEDGTITPVKEGKTTIKVKQAESKNYLAGEKAFDVEVTAPTASKEALAAVEWAKMIANDNSFAYGAGKKAHRGGCYFCGTNKRKKPKGYEKTYCCNPFIFAAYAHGAEIPSVLNSCQSGGCGGMSPSDWTPHGFTLLGEAKDIPYEELLPGDVILSDQNKNHWVHHVWMIADNGDYVEASGGGWGKNSIAVKSNAKKNYSRYQRHFCQVMRYGGN